MRSPACICRGIYTSFNPREFFTAETRRRGEEKGIATDERRCAQMEEGIFGLIYLCSSASIRGKICSLRLRASAVRILVGDDLCRYLWMYIRGCFGTARFCKSRHFLCDPVAFIQCGVYIELTHAKECRGG